MDSFNFRNILRWIQPDDLRGDVIYTVQSKIDTNSTTADYKTICVTHELQCDSSVITTKSYVRVKAQLNFTESEWTTIHFDPLSEGFWKIPAPINVTMDSFNFKNILRWNRPANLRGDVIYTVEYKMDTISATTNFKTICVNREQQCDSSAITYKSYVRVKAQLNSSQSEWTTIHFDPFSETIIGYPELKVSSRSGYLDVSVDGPFIGTNRETLKERYGEITYNVLYWKESDPEQVFIINLLQNTDILGDLETWTMYCVKVQAYVPEYNRTGKFSPVTCRQTTEGTTPSWKIVVIFLGAMALSAVFILLMAFVIFKAYGMIHYLFFPSYSFPQHLKEYLSGPFYGASYLPPQPSDDCGESSEQLTFISEEKDAV